VKNVLNFKKPARIIMIAAIALAAALVVVFAVNGTEQKTDNKPVAVKNSSGATLFELDAGNGGKMTLYTDAITKLSALHHISGKSTRYGVVDKTSIASIGDWVGGLSVKREYFADGQTPGDSDGGEGYNFDADDGAGFVGLFAYGIYGSDRCYIIFNDAWYKVNNPSYPPIPETDAITVQSFGWTPIEDLPLDYGKDEAIADGIYVNIHGSEIYNQKLVDIFYESVFAGNSAYMRTMVYTVEGDPIITDYQFDGNSFTVIHDARRDNFGSQEITSATYRYLVPLDRSRPAGTQMQYVLSNEQNIYTGTGDGGLTLIEDLRYIPSPSDDVTPGDSRQLTYSPSSASDPLEDIKNGETRGNEQG
jgi:hypothetical protein